MRDEREDQQQANSHRKSNRGFAAMDSDTQRRIASKGGRAAHEQGTAHEFSPTEAREAGRKGGQAVSRNRAHMAEIGRRGGEARGANRRRVVEPRDGGTQSDGWGESGN
ncbi:MAG TPA: KGG domain-containing protein [Gemmatimonadaceae bacterium]|nr:KGG domain-containing protein [Gemmatimonadaceae bacterium]